MTEPGAGSDLQAVRTTARRDGDVYVLNGPKTFITNGILADLMIVVAKTDPEAGHKGISLLVVERGMAGFERGRNLDKIGLKAQDTAEPSSPTSTFRRNLLGEEGQGFPPDATSCRRNGYRSRSRRSPCREPALDDDGLLRSGPRSASRSARSRPAGSASPRWRPRSR